MGRYFTGHASVNEKKVTGADDTADRRRLSKGISYKWIFLNRRRRHYTLQ